MVQTYFSAESWFQKVLAAERACFVGLWLGVLSPNKLYATVEEYYTRSGRSLQGHHDYHSKEYNRGGLFDWEKDALTRHFGHSKRLLLLGAGGGREALAFLQSGYDVDGYESHPDLVAAANELLREEGFEPIVHLIAPDRSEEHTSELQSRVDLVCRLLLEKKKKYINTTNNRQKKKTKTHLH